MLRKKAELISTGISCLTHMPIKQCSCCRTQSNNGKYCSGCGASFFEEVPSEVKTAKATLKVINGWRAPICTNCGSELKNGYCHNCGAKVDYSEVTKRLAKG